MRPSIAWDYPPWSQFEKRLRYAAMYGSLEVPCIGDPCDDCTHWIGAL